MKSKRTPKPSRCPESCRAICCQYITYKIQAPRTKLDFDELYWFLCHEQVAVFIERRKWYLLVDVPCRHLNERYRCDNYARRPFVCRMHADDSCEYSGEVDFDLHLRTPEDLRRYMEKRGLRYRMAWMEPEDPSQSTPARPGRKARTGGRGGSRGGR